MNDRICWSCIRCRFQSKGLVAPIFTPLRDDSFIARMLPPDVASCGKQIVARFATFLGIVPNRKRAGKHVAKLTRTIVREWPTPDKIPRRFLHVVAIAALVETGLRPTP